MDVGGGGTDKRVTLSDLGTLTVDPGFDADATKALVNLDLKASFGGKAVFPSLESDFTLDWKQIADPGDATNLIVTFDNVRMNLGSFLSEMAYGVFEQVQHVLAPLNSTLNSDLIGDKSLLEVLIDPIPGISYALGRDVNFLDLMNFTGKAEIPEATEPAIRAIINILDIYSFLESVMKTPDYGSGLNIEFGKFTVGGDQLQEEVTSIIPSVADTGWVDQISNWSGGNSELDSLIEGLDGRSEEGEDLIPFSFPFLDDPLSLFCLMLGRTETFENKPIDLFVFNLPDGIGVNASWTDYVPFPPFPVIGLDLTVGLGFNLDLGFGYDTDGIRAYKDGGYSDPTDLFLGFYVSDWDDQGNDVPEVKLSGTVGIGVNALGLAGGEVSW